jgi:alcohol dehydrogenase, propanol-preferring
MSLPEEMRAMVLNRQGEPLCDTRLRVPRPGPGQALIRVSACGVCRTDLHVIDGELAEPKLPLIPGHMIVGTVADVGPLPHRTGIGDRVGIPWLGFSCGSCRYCLTGRENLCDHALFTGYTLDGGYAEYVLADQRFCLQISEGPSDVELAPLLCAGLIGYRCYRMTGEGVDRLGIYGFGNAAHIITQIAVHQGKRVFGFTSPGDLVAQEFARKLGAVWAGDSTEPPPDELDAAILFAPVGSLVPAALRALAKGGTVVCGGIHMTDIPSFGYNLLWGERVIRSVANLTRADGDEFLRLAASVPVKTEVELFSLTEANEALHRLRSGRIRGAAVLDLSGPPPGQSTG